jgi:hypothetical protein
MNKDEALAMDLALEALDIVKIHFTQNRHVNEAITAIKQVRSAPVQEPVAWMYWQSCLNDDGTQTAPWVQRYSKFKPPESVINKEITPLYTTPPAQPAPVQEPVFCEYCGGNDDADFGLPTDHCTDCARPQPAAQEDIQRLSALVRAQQITIDKLEQVRSAPVQEPVAIVDEDGVIVVCNYKYKPGDKLYTAPPGGRQSEDCLTAAQQEIQRLSALVRAQQITIEKLEAQRPVAEPHKWVGLTVEEINSVRYRRDWTAPWTDTTFARAIEAKLKEKNA